MNFPGLFSPPPSTYSSRREFLARAGNGLGLLALASLADPAIAEQPHNPLTPKASHLPAKAKSIIWLFMNGGPSQVDTWDYKPKLAELDGQELKGFDKNTGFFTE